MFGFGRRKEEKAEARNVPVSAPNFLELMGWTDLASSSGVTVTVDRALSVPSVWAAVNFLSGTMASLPIGVYTQDEKGQKSPANNSLNRILHDAPNDEQSSFEFRKGIFDAVFTGGRAFAYIERDRSGLVVNLWPFDPSTVRVRRVDGRKVYTVNNRQYEASEIIDIPFMLKADMVSHRGPIAVGKDAIAMAVSATKYGAKVFQSGGLPPAVLSGPFASGAAARRASDDVAQATLALASEGKSILAVPAGHDIKALGFNAEQMQLLELQRFCVEQIARLYSLPPVFLQDLTHGTFSNTEQQDLHFVKHTLHRWVKQFEQELTLKLFGRDPRFKVEMNLDGLLRGDIKTRMEAHAVAINNGIYSPAHAAYIEDQPVRPEADVIMVQGAMVPIGSAGNNGGSNGT
jgi:HK97 family phage portal protein